MKRRVLEKLKITEISGVDRPCQEHARVAIMKRAEPAGDGGALASKVAKLAEDVEKVEATLNKFWSVAARVAAIEARRRLARLAGRKVAEHGFLTDLAHFAVAQEAKRRVRRGAPRLAGFAAAGAVGGYVASRHRKKD